ncbi:MAG: DUF5317 family protein [Sporichthyaceae bacterium]
MGLTLLVVALALVPAVAVPSRPGHRPRLRALGVLSAACLLLVGEPLLGERVPGAYPVLLAVAALLLGRFALVNRCVPGVVLACAGVGLNAAVVLANGAMPVEQKAVVRAGLDPAAAALDADRRREFAGDGTDLRWLGERIAVPTPVRSEVVSLGDVATAAGLGLFVFGYARRHRRELDPALLSSLAPGTGQGAAGRLPPARRS